MSLKQWCVLSALACTLTSAGVASAADLKFNSQVDLSFKGQIRSVGACDLTLENGGIVDIGNLSKGNFPDPPYYKLKRLPFQVSCPRPTKVGFVLTDNFSAVDQGEQTFALSNPDIGSYSMVLSVDDYRAVNGKRATSLRRSYADNWHTPSWGGWTVGRGNVYSWGIGLGSDPVAGTWMQDMLKITVYFKGKDIAFTDEMEIAGSATLELVYL